MQNTSGTIGPLNNIIPVHWNNANVGQINGMNFNTNFMSSYLESKTFGIWSVSVTISGKSDLPTVLESQIYNNSVVIPNLLNNTTIVPGQLTSYTIT